MYKTVIKSGHVSGSYENYTNLSSILLMFTIWLTTVHTINGHLPKKYNYLSILANVLNLVCVIILYNILAFYTTDG
jgi:hypothetical protein